MTRHILAILLATASTMAFAAQPIEPCALLSAADLAELGVPADASRSVEAGQGGVLYCRYQVPGATTGVSSASVILSTAVPDRVLLVRAMLDKARESNPAQLEARGEYLAPNVTCKVATVSQVETSQCLGTTEQSVVGLSLVRMNKDDKVAYPGLQLRVISRLVSSVGERGG